MMRRLSAYFAALLLLFSCSRVEPMVTGEVPMSLSVSSSELVVEGPDGKAANPLDPSVENTIVNLWILQYSEDGILVKQEYVPLDHAVLNTELKTKFKRGDNCTIVIIANMGGLFPENPEWPTDASDFRWGEHGAGSLYNIQNKLFDVSLKSMSRSHLYMVGAARMNVNDESVAQPVNIILSRLAAKFKVSIKSKTADTYSNVRLQLINCPTRMGFFPVDHSFGPGDMENYDAEQLCGVGEYLPAENYTTLYYYANENLCSDAAGQTKLRILADKGGSPVSTELAVSPIGKSLRNTCYNIQITLK